MSRKLSESESDFAQHGQVNIHLCALSAEKDTEQNSCLKYYSHIVPSNRRFGPGSW